MLSSEVLGKQVQTVSIPIEHTNKNSPQNSLTDFSEKAADTIQKAVAANDL